MYTKVARCLCFDVFARISRKNTTKLVQSPRHLYRHAHIKWIRFEMFLFVILVCVYCTYINLDSN